MAHEINESNFNELVINSGKPVVLDFGQFGAALVGMIAPIIEEMSKEYGDKAVIGKVDVDNNNEIAVKYGIRNIPTVLFLKNGEVVDKVVGAVPKSTLTAKLDSLL